MAEQLIEKLHEITTTDPAQALATHAREYLAGLPADRHLHIAISLSGLPATALDALALLVVDWDRVHVWQVDEALAPLGSDARTGAALIDLVVGRIGLDPSRLHLMDVDALDVETSARRFSDALGAACGGELDLILLGLAPDGRTAGWGFADPTLELDLIDVVVSRPAIGAPTMTMTPACINRAGSRVFAVEDLGSEIALVMLRAGSRRVPAGMVTRQGTTLVVTHSDRPDNVELDRIEIDEDAIAAESRPHLDELIIDLRPFDTVPVATPSGGMITARDLLIGDGPLSLAPPIVTASRLAKSFQVGERRSSPLVDVSFDLELGESLAIMGASGSGKSTLLEIVAGLQRADSGTVVINGRVVGSGTDDEESVARRGSIGFVFQSFRLLHDLTVWENVVVPAVISGGRARRHRSRALELLDTVGLADRAERRPRELSGGECQRVAIARALMSEPRIVLADEPTGNLDDATVDLVLEALRVVTSAGPALIVATHDSSVASMCHRTFELVEGGLRRSQPASTYSAN